MEVGDFKEQMIQIQTGSDPVSVVDVYLKRCSSDPGDETHLQTELSLVNGTAVFSLVGVLPSSLRLLAAMLSDYADDIVSDATF